MVNNLWLDKIYFSSCIEEYFSYQSSNSSKKIKIKFEFVKIVRPSRLAGHFLYLYY